MERNAEMRVCPLGAKPGPAATSAAVWAPHPSQPTGPGARTQNLLFCMSFHSFFIYASDL